MSKDQIQEIWKQETDKYAKQRIGRYAIKNIKERLELKYGDNFKLEINSKIGVGTTVILILPYEGGSIVSVKLLVADDEDTIRRGVVKYLQLHTDRFDKIYEAENGQEAIDAVLKFQPDMILLDVQMPLKTELK